MEERRQRHCAIEFHATRHYGGARPHPPTRSCLRMRSSPPTPTRRLLGTRRSRPRGGRTRPCILAEASVSGSAVGASLRARLRGRRPPILEHPVEPRYLGQRASARTVWYLVPASREPWFLARRAFLNAGGCRLTQLGLKTSPHRSRRSSAERREPSADLRRTTAGGWTRAVAREPRSTDGSRAKLRSAVIDAEPLGGLSCPGAAEGRVAALALASPRSRHFRAGIDRPRTRGSVSKEPRRVEGGPVLVPAPL
jgi:hypothetical protein